MLNPVLLCVEAFKAVSSMVYSLYKELHFPGSSLAVGGVQTARISC